MAISSRSDLLSKQDSPEVEFPGSSCFLVMLNDVDAAGHRCDCLVESGLPSHSPALQTYMSCFLASSAG